MAGERGLNDLCDRLQRRASMRPRLHSRGKGAFGSMRNFTLIAPIFRAVIGGSFGTETEMH